MTIIMKAAEATIESIVFDVGWVLVQLDFAPLLSRLGPSDDYDIKEVLAAIDLEAHERGELNSSGLIDRLHGLAPQANRNDLKRGWLDMFSPVESMFALARKLGERYRVHLLSNVGALHWAHLNALYDLRGLVNSALPSFEAGVMKPSPEIYRIAEHRFRLQPSRTVFIDDLEPNVRAARQRGWHAIHHASPQQTMQSLRELGVEC